MASKIQQIRDAKKALAGLRAKRQKMYDNFMKDGKLHPRKEKPHLDRIDGKISKLDAALDALIKQWEANKAAWEARAADLQRVNSQIADLKAWEHIDYKAVETILTKIDKDVGAEVYAQAPADLDGAIAKINPLHEEYVKQKEAKEKHDAIMTEIETDLADASACEYFGVATIQENMVTEQTAADKAVAEHDWVTALPHTEKLKSLLAEYKTEYERLDQLRLQYEGNLPGAMDRIAVRSVSEAKFNYIADLQSTLATAQGEMEKAAEIQDWENADRLLLEVMSTLDDIDAKIEEKKKEYETARAAVDTKLQDVVACKYQKFQALVTKIEGTLTPVDDAAADEDYQSAMDLLKNTEKEIDDFKAQLAKYEDELKKEINKTFPDLKKKADEYKDAKSALKGTVRQYIVNIENALNGPGDLEEAVKDVKELAKMIPELAAISLVQKRLDDKWDINKDDEARKIVQEMKANGTLKNLPMEARNMLVESMMDGVRTKEDHAAIQEIWKTPAIDRKFAEFDKKTRDSIVNKYKDDPEVQKIAADWKTMSEADKKKAVEKLTQIPCGPDGWNVGEVENFKYKNEAFTEDKKSYGSYNHENNRMMVNLHDHAHGNFTELLDTLAHEVGHRYQSKLIERYDSGDLQPGDVEYDQAKALKLCEDYRTSDYKQFKKVYSSSPEEAHSREMGSDIQKGLKGTYGPGGSTYTGGGGGGGGSGGGSKYDHDHDHDHDHDEDDE